MPDDLSDLCPKPRPCHLPEDALHEIWLYLSTREKLNFSLLSKSFHSVFPVRPTSVTCSKPSTIASLRRYLARKPGVAMCLVTLVIITGFGKHKTTGQRRRRKELQQDLCSILSAARNLHQLICISSVEYWNAQARGALEALPRLSHLRISKSGGDMLVYPSSLVSLHLTGLQDGYISWHDVARMLSGLPGLVELLLEDPVFVESDHEDDYDDEARALEHPIPHPMLRRLVVTSLHQNTEYCDSSASLSFLGRQFPDLKTLVLEDTNFIVLCGLGFVPVKPIECSSKHAALASLYTAR